MSARHFIAAVSLCLAAHADASPPTNITAGEMARLPEYCADAQLFETRGMPDNPTPRQRQWVGMMGRTFWHIHHYCWALIRNHRVDHSGLTAQDKEFLLTSAIADGIYVLQNQEPDFPLLPEVLVRIGQYNLRLNRLGQALEYFQQSRQAKADYWPAYIGLSDANLQLGRRQASIDALNEGLQRIPNDPRLLAALEKINREPASSATPAPKPRQAATKTSAQSAAKPPAKP